MARAAERTLNMFHMFVTWDVSKLSGWLNAVASCRIEEGHVMRAEVCRPGGGGARARGAVAVASGVHVEDQRLGGWGGGHARRSGQ